MIQFIKGKKYKRIEDGTLWTFCHKSQDFGITMYYTFKHLDFTLIVSYPEKSFKEINSKVITCWE